jgi:hypothetical protein
VTLVHLLASVVRLVGLLATFLALWFMAGGLRTVVSGRIDERRRSATSLQIAVPLLVAGLLLLVTGHWLVVWAG